MKKTFQGKDHLYFLHMDTVNEMNICVKKD